MALLKSPSGRIITYRTPLSFFLPANSMFKYLIFFASLLGVIKLRFTFTTVKETINKNTFPK